MKIAKVKTLLLNSTRFVVLVFCVYGRLAYGDENNILPPASASTSSSPSVEASGETAAKVAATPNEEWYIPPQGTDVAERACEFQAEGFLKNQVIDKNCFTLAYGKSSVQQKVLSATGDLFVVVYRNVIYFIDKSKAGKEVRMIAGEMPALHDLRAVALSPNGQDVAVLDVIQEGGRDKVSIKIFPTRRNGSVAPSRILKGDFIEGAVDLKFHPRKAELFVLSRDPARIQVFSTEADSRSTEEKKKVRVLREISGAKTMLKQPSHLVIAGNRVFVLDKGAEKILRFSLDSQGAVPPKSQDLPAGESDSLRWQAHQKEIQLLDGKQEVMKRWPAMVKTQNGE